MIIPLVCMSPGAAVMIGQVVAFDEHGHVLVQADGVGPTVAELTEAAQRSLSRLREVVGRSVLIAREQHAPERLVVLDVLRDRLERRPLRADDVQRISAKPLARRTGRDEVEPAAGRSASMLDVLGRLVIRGVELLSRARSPKRTAAPSLEMN